MRKYIFLFIFIILINNLNSLQQLEELSKKVEQLGKLKFKDEISIRYLEKNILEEKLKKRLEEYFSKQLTQKEILYLKLMGFIRGDIELGQYRKKVLINNVGGYYDSGEKELFLLPGNRKINFINSMLIVHELRHYLQDQHYGIENILGEKLSDFDDRRIAATALIEGDATLIMLMIAGLAPDIMRGSGHSEALVTYLPLANITAVIDVPRILKKQLLMPYFQGLDFASYLYEKRGFKGLNSAMKSPPVSSEQILHPKKYFKKEQPIAVKISYKPHGYQLFYTGVVGEYFINVLLEGGNDISPDIIGWGGDRYCIYRKAGHYVFAWETEWDEEKYCTRFFYRFKRFLQDNYKIKFRKSSKKKLNFRAGRSGNDFFFLYSAKKRIFYLRTNNREEINKFIKGGYYD